MKRNTLIGVIVGCVVAGWCANWLMSERYRFQAVGNGIMIRTDRWTGAAWKSYGASEQWMAMREKMPEPVIKTVEREFTKEENEQLQIGVDIQAYRWGLENPRGGVWHGSKVAPEEVAKLMARLRKDYAFLLKEQ